MLIKKILLISSLLLVSGCSVSISINNSNLSSSNISNSDIYLSSGSDSRSDQLTSETKSTKEVTLEEFSAYLDTQIEYEKENLVKTIVDSNDLGYVSSLITTIYKDNYVSGVNSNKFDDGSENTHNYWFYSPDNYETIYQYNFYTMDSVGINPRANSFESLFFGSNGLIAPATYSKASIDGYESMIKSITKSNNEYIVSIEPKLDDRELLGTFTLELNEDNHIVKITSLYNYGGSIYSASITATYGERDNPPEDIVNLFKDGIDKLIEPSFIMEVDEKVRGKEVKCYKNLDKEEISKESFTGFNGNSNLTSASVVETTLSKATLGGMYKGNVDFLAYTVYLENSSEIPVNLHCFAQIMDSDNLDNLLSITRILVQIDTLDSSDVTNLYYGSEVKPISSFYIEKIDGETRYISTFSSSGNDGYCLPFVNKELNKNLNYTEFVVPANKMIRLTMAIYFEGYDLNASSYSIISGYLNPSFHIGM